MAQRRFFANTKDRVRIACSRSKFISRLYAPFAKTQEFGENRLAHTCLEADRCLHVQI